MERRTLLAGTGLIATLILIATPALAQITTGTVTGIPAMTLEPGALAETITVVGESPIAQSQSGERSFAITSTQIQNLPRRQAARASAAPGSNGPLP